MTSRVYPPVSYVDMHLTAGIWDATVSLLKTEHREQQSLLDDHRCQALLRMVGKCWRIDTPVSYPKETAVGLELYGIGSVRVCSRATSALAS